jgi:hypothetical protein
MVLLLRCAPTRTHRRARGAARLCLRKRPLRPPRQTHVRRDRPLQTTPHPSRHPRRTTRPQPKQPAADLGHRLPHTRHPRRRRVPLPPRPHRLPARHRQTPQLTPPTTLHRRQWLALRAGERRRTRKRLGRRRRLRTKVSAEALVGGAEGNDRGQSSSLRQRPSSWPAPAGPARRLRLRRGSSRRTSGRPSRSSRRW